MSKRVPQKISSAPLVRVKTSTIYGANIRASGQGSRPQSSQHTGEQPSRLSARSQFKIQSSDSRVSQSFSPTTSVAIIVTGRNRATLLRSCLESVFNQTRPADQVVYVDDNSTDDSLAIAAEFVPKGLNVHFLETHGGIPFARNAGVSLTQSEYILHVDSDNIIPATYLAGMLSEIGNNEVVYPRKKFIGEDEFLPEEETWNPPSYSRASLWHHNYIDTCSLIRRESLLACGGWRDTPADYLFDWDLMLRLTRIGPAVRSSEYLHYRIHSSNWTKETRNLPKEQLQAQVRRHAATLSLATVWSGRMDNVFHGWMEAIRTTLKGAGKTTACLRNHD